MMTCDCDHYINCNDKPIEVGVYDDETNYAHDYHLSIDSNDVLGFYQKTDRTFSVEHGWDRDITPGYVLSGCGSDLLTCDSRSTATPHAVCSEHCKRQVNVPFYWDRQRDIYVWKHIEEELTFSIVSDKTAAFKQKFGTASFHKICIPTSVKTSGVERFIMRRGGVQSVLAEVSYQYNPFPAAEGGGSTWGLYGNPETRSAEPDTPDVACILLFPLVPKQSIPMDNDVIAYGFYDYNSTEGGFIESSLPGDDGGKDYFYPYWCRQMPADPIWRQTADTRYEVIYSHGQMNLEGSSPWYPPAPANYPWPFGSFALDSKQNFIASCLLQFGQRADNKGIVYNAASFGDLFAAITQTGVPFAGTFKAFHPVAPL